MQPEEMNDGVRLLAKRMETNPEEFADDARWGNFEVDRFEGFLYPEEINYLSEKLKQAKRQNFTTAVLKILTGTDN